MPAILDPDAPPSTRPFKEAGRPPYETVTPAEARELYLKGRVSNPEPPELESVRPTSIPAPRLVLTPRHMKTVRKPPPAFQRAWFSPAWLQVIGDLD